MTTRREFLGAFAAPLIFADHFEAEMTTITIPAPVGGINARDAFTAMPPTDAVCLVSMVPEQTYLETAPPVLTYWASNANVRTLIPYEVNGSAKLLAVIDSGSNQWDIVDITNSASPSTLASNLDGASSGAFYWTIFNSLAIICTGNNDPQVYNGTTCTNAVITGPADPATLRGCITFKGRVYYWDFLSQSFWYAAAGSYQGALTEFPVNLVTSKGGYIVQLASLTRDGGEGADDLFVILFNTGEVIIYQGDDPGSASAWELVGKFQMPRPMGGRSMHKVGGNLLCVTTDGIADLNRVLAGDPYPLVNGKAGELPGFKTLPSTDNRDLIGIVEFAETGSLTLIDRGVSNRQIWKLNPDALLCLKKNTGAWWAYRDSEEDGWSSDAIACSCVFQGRTYFGGSEVMRVVQGSGNTESMYSVWQGASHFGFSFAPQFAEYVGSFGTIRTNYTIDNAGGFGTYGDIGAFVAPFNGMNGQVTMKRYTYGKVENFWSGVGNPDKFRWYKTDLWLKKGGKM